MIRAGRTVSILVLVTLAVIGAARADYGRMTLFQMLLDAERIVWGEIVSTGEQSYELAVEDTLLGAPAPDVITVRRVEQAAPLAQRWTAYAPGQRIVLFAAPSEQPPGSGADELVPLGAAGEGEVPILDGSAILQQLAGNPRPAEVVAADGAVLEGYPVGLTNLAAAIVGFGDCFAAAATEPAGIGRSLSQICNDDALAAYIAQSWLAAHLAGIAERLTDGS